MKIFRIVAAVMMLLFAALQYNDPDPLFWMVIYGLTSAVCFLSIKLKSKFFIVSSLVLSIVFLGYAGYNWPSTWMGFEQTIPPSLDAEKARESVGFIIAALFIAIAIIKR